MQEYRVLIVDDDVSWQENLKETVESIDFVARVAGDFEEANAELDRRHFHLALVDLRLNEGSPEPVGMKLVQKVSQLDEGTSVIIISGYADATIATEALKRYDAFYVLEKEKTDVDQFVAVAKDAVSVASERYRDKFSSAIDFLRGDQDTHSWAALVCRCRGLKPLRHLPDPVSLRREAYGESDRDRLP